jgi:hypothetical protein
MAGCGGAAIVGAELEPAAGTESVLASAPAPMPEAELRAEPKAEPARTSWGHADLDPSNDLVVGPPAPVLDCEDRLRAAGVTFKPARIGLKKKDGGGICGAEQVVRFKKGPGAIAYGNAPLLTCSMAIAFADFERILQEEAERALGSRVVRIDHLGTFNCREMAAYDLISEHSFANGIDLRRFHLADGRAVDVLKHFVPEDDAATDARTLFLRRLGNRLFDEDVFSNVVTPYFDALHRNHIHVDLARYRVDGSRP